MGTGMTQSRRRILMNTPHIETVSDSIITTNAALPAPIKSLKASFVPVQSGSGDPSPENYRPISGWTGCNLIVSPTQSAQDGTTYPVSWQTEAGTVYGGNVDLITGVLTVNMVIKTVTSVVGYTNGYAMVYVGPYAYVNVSGLKICNMLKHNAVSAGSLAYGEFNVFNSSGYNRAHMAFKISGLNTKDKCDEYLQALADNGTPMQVCFEISEPVTYQLAPQQLNTLRGVNNIWSDTNGNTEIQYWTH